MVLLCYQLAVGSGEHPLAAAPVRHAEGSHSGVLGGGVGRPARPGSLLRWMGPHTPDSSTRQDSVGPLLSDVRGASVRHVGVFSLLNAYVVLLL